MRRDIVVTAFYAIFLLCCVNLRAALTSANQAVMVVTGWLKTDAAPLDTLVGQQIKTVQTFTDDSGQPIYYIVYLQPNGFVIVSADDLIEPIIGFTQENIYDPSPGNPLGALVTADLNGRMESVRAGIPAQTKAVTGKSARPQNKWNNLLRLAESQQNDIGLLGLSGIDDVRVAPLVQSRWHQKTCCSSPALACYNYYTPGPPNASGEGDPDNYWCGCVATALAQIMRYHQYPYTGIGTNSFDIKIRGAAYSRQTRGGDGSGGSYNWADMVLVPDCSTALTQRQAIGALCHDAGVGISNLVSGLYTYYDSDGTVAYTESAKAGLKSTFKYGNAIYGYNGGFDIGDGLIGMVNPNLDASLPVCFGIKGGGSVGHQVVCDGYGYNFGTMYHHLNMGWAGSQDAWYDLPDINSSPSYSSVYETIYNIYKLGSGEVISGRVTNPAGNPLSGVTVKEYIYPGPSVPSTRTTNAQGIYAFAGIKSNTDHAVYAVKTGYIFPGHTIAHTGLSSDSQSSSGNLWGVDIVCIPPDVNSITPTSGPAGTYMKIQGTNFGTSPGSVVFPGGYTGQEVQWSDTLILCKNSCPYSGDVIVRSSVGVDSEGVYFDVTDPATIYVDVNHTPDVENGSVSYPFSKIQRGIDAATYTDTVIVKPGAYNENISLNEKYITLTGMNPNDPNIVASTIIDGGGNGSVVTLTYEGSVVTGFTITNGSTEESGGGIYCYGQGEETTPAISYCLIVYNSADTGGGICCSESGPTITYCTIAGNSAANDFLSGGGIYNYSEEGWYTATISHCLIAGNLAGGGGGICSVGDNTTISHCDITGNIAQGGGGIVCAAGNMIVHHTILWDDAAVYGPEIAMVNFGAPPALTIAYSDVKEGLIGVYQMDGTLNWDENSMIDANPMFVRDPNAGPDGYWDGVEDDFGDLHLDADSPCIDTGDPNFIPDPGTSMDMDGQPRIVGCRVDMGMDEFVYLGDMEPDGDVDLTDFAVLAGCWQDTNCGIFNGADLTRDGIVDIADLIRLAENWLNTLCHD